MKTRYFFTVFVLLALTACGQRSGEMKKYAINQKARQLNDSAYALTMNFIDSLRYVKAISSLTRQLLLIAITLMLIGINLFFKTK